jgi:hypothetical protein
MSVKSPLNVRHAKMLSKKKVRRKLKKKTEPTWSMTFGKVITEIKIELEDRTIHTKITRKK